MTTAHLANQTVLRDHFNAAGAHIAQEAKRETEGFGKKRMEAYVERKDEERGNALVSPGVMLVKVPLCELVIKIFVKPNYKKSKHEKSKR